MMNTKKMMKSPMVAFLAGLGLMFLAGKYKIISMGESDLVRLD